MESIAYPTQDQDQGSSDEQESTSESDLEMVSEEAIQKDLAGHFILREKRVLDRPEFKSFKDRVEKAVKTKRKSDVALEEEQEYLETFRMYRNKNEAALTYAITPFINKPKLTVEDVDQDGNPKYMIRGYPAQGVIVVPNEEFARNRLPNMWMYSPDATETYIRQKMSVSEALTTPKPDFAYGIVQDKLPKPPLGVTLSAETQALLDIASEREIFLVWENKSDAGNLIKCENQAARDGAALNFATLQLLDRIGETRKPGIHEDAYVYAATNNNKLLSIWICYVYIPPDPNAAVEFHMDIIDTLDMDAPAGEDKNDPKVLANLRRPIHNIVEWGSMGRLSRVRSRYDKIFEWERGQLRRDVEQMEAESKTKKGIKRGADGKAFGQS